MRNQIMGLDKSLKNIQDGIFVMQIDESTVEEVDNILKRMIGLLIQPVNQINNKYDRLKITTELNESYNEIDRISNST